ncbi:hypothetical protein PAT3040_02658 [Paenibacillus agaridevorans]|uniref:Type II secretion system protein GspF domain-containing protein n=1 Tax=Paenibacillus agaridevorans TaxID=171404 RepID=A0A2R5EXL5_9BACL|nr:hypothetical protein [Paenibacillus agaridevorans]GBG08091.1 hypothetical protein PAT3040_02658 [Paenibacillus agaridevorans]
MAILLIKMLLYSMAATGMLLLARELHYVRRRSPPPLMRQAEAWFTSSRPAMERWYKDPKWEGVAAEAGLSSLTAWSFKLVRDVVFILLTLIVHVVFLMTKEYPLAVMIILAVLYVLLLTGRSFMPANLLLGAVGKERRQQKNDEVVLLFMLFTNDCYTETADHYQSVMAKLKEYRRYLKALRKDIDQLIFDLPLDGPSAFTAFGARIGSKEAKMLALIMAKINESNPDTASDLLEQHYESFLDYRRQRRKRKLRSNGYIGFTVVFLAIIAVIFFISTLAGAYQDTLMNVL